MIHGEMDMGHNKSFMNTTSLSNPNKWYYDHCLCYSPHPQKLLMAYLATQMTDPIPRGKQINRVWHNYVRYPITSTQTQITQNEAFSKLQ